MGDVLSGKWRQFKGEAKSAWGKLTDDDVAQIEGDYDTLVGKLQERYGWEKAEAQRKAKAWIDSL